MRTNLPRQHNSNYQEQHKYIVCSTTYRIYKYAETLVLPVFLPLSVFLHIQI